MHLQLYHWAPITALGRINFSDSRLSQACNRKRLKPQGSPKGFAMLNEGFQPQAEVTIGYQHCIVIWGFRYCCLPHETLIFICGCSLPLEFLARPSHTFLVMRSFSFMCLLTNAFSSASTIVRRVDEGSKGKRKSVRIAGSDTFFFYDSCTLSFLSEQLLQEKICLYN